MNFGFGFWYQTVVDIGLYMHSLILNEHSFDCFSFGLQFILSQAQIYVFL